MAMPRRRVARARVNGRANKKERAEHRPKA